LREGDQADDGCYPNQERVTNLPAEQHDETVYCDQRRESITGQWLEVTVSSNYGAVYLKW